MHINSNIPTIIDITGLIIALVSRNMNCNRTTYGCIVVVQNWPTFSFIQSIYSRNLTISFCFEMELIPFVNCPTKYWITRRQNGTFYCDIYVLLLMSFVMSQLQKALFDTNIHEHNNNIHVIMLCLETLIKVYTYRLHKSHQGRSDGIRVILSTIADDQRNKTAFCMKWTHSFAQWAAVH